jgi:integrase
MAYAERNSKTKKLTGRWCADAVYKHANGTTLRMHKAFAGKQEAEGAEAYFRATGEVPPHLMKTAGDSYRAWAEKFKERSVDWLNAHDGTTNAQRLNLSIEFFDGTPIRAVRTAKLEEYVDHLIKRVGYPGRPPASRTINYYLDAVSKVLRFALERDAIEGMPKMPRRENKGQTRDALTWPVEDAICAWLAGRGEAASVFLIRVLSATGMRCGELYSTRPEQIEVLSDEQGEYAGVLLTEEQTKTNAARWVPLHASAAKHLRAMIGSGSMPNAAHLYQQFKRAVEELGDRSAYTLHSLRHTNVTRLLQTKAEGLDVAKIVGHSIPGVPKMTMRYYHPDKRHLFDVAEKVQIRFGETTQKHEVVPFVPAARSA